MDGLSTNAMFLFFYARCRSALLEEVGKEGLKRVVPATYVFCSKVFGGLGPGTLGGSKCSLFPDSHGFLSRKPGGVFVIAHPSGSLSRDPIGFLTH